MNPYKGTEEKNTSGVKQKHEIEATDLSNNRWVSEESKSLKNVDEEKFYKKVSD